MNFDEDLFVGEAAYAGVGQRQFQIVRDRTGQRQVTVAGDEFHGVQGPFARVGLRAPLASEGR